MFIGIVKCIVLAITISILYGVIGYLNHKKADYRRRFDGKLWLPGKKLEVKRENVVCLIRWRSEKFQFAEISKCKKQYTI